MSLSRRGFLGTGLAALGGLSLTRTAAVTPHQTEGPFYPRRLPRDSDTDLVKLAGRPGPATGTVTHVFGRILAEDGRPMTGVRVEIWQCDAFGHYHHAGGTRPGAKGGPDRALDRQRCRRRGAGRSLRYGSGP